MDVANTFATLALLGKEIPHLWGLRSSGVASGLVPNASFRIAKVLSKRATVAVANSDAVHEFYQSAGFRPKKWGVVPNGVDSALFKPHRSQVNSGAVDSSSKEVVVGMVARADRIKRYDILFEMIAALKYRYPKISWKIGGLGTDNPNGLIFDLLQQSGVKDDVEVLGEIKDVPALMATFDISICCSDFEGSANSILEAISCGVPVVSFDVGDAAVLLENCGVIVHPPTAEALGRSVAELLDDFPRRQNLGIAGRQRVENNYGVDTMAQRTRDIMVSVLNCPNG